jgi:hypothetical protein
MTQIWKAWNHFWFEPQSPEPMGFFRILFGLVLLANGLLLAPDLLNYFGPDGFLSLPTSQLVADGLRINIFNWLSDANLSTVFVFLFYLIASFTLTVGFWTRTSAAIVFLTLVSFHHRNLLILSSGDTLMRLISFLLIFSQAGTAYSIDQIRKGGVVVASSPWAQRLIQYQVSLVYLMGVLWKLDGSTWIDGTAMYYASRLEEFWRFPVPYLFEHMWTLKLITWVTLNIELALGTLIWFRKYRYPVIIAGVLMHLGIEYAMNIQLFEWLMIACYAVFIEPEDLKRASYATNDFCRRVLCVVQRLCGLGSKEGQA